ncbi:MAG TPA: protein kinase [Thermoanaerobaculia bacterium]|jgi:TolB-like protein
MALERGSSIGPYQVLFRLGSGGMGEVWRARDTRLDRDVAIKVLSQDAVRDADRMRRFAMEARAASSLNHPNILTVHEIGESEAGPYLVTEYVDGETVRAILTEGPMPLARAVDVALQAAEGVANAHAVGIVHRDLKPENLMVNREGLVKILDFGLAKLLRPGEVSEDNALNIGHTATGMIIGTAGYLSPEQLRGEKASERSDVFALGVVLYEMATGENPFRRNNAVDTFTAILRDDPPPLEQKLGAIPEDLSRIVRKALAKKPEDRYASARELAVDLKPIRSRVDLEESATEVLPSGSLPRRAPAAHPLRRWVVAAAGIASLAAAAFVVVRSGAVTRLAPVELPHDRLAVAVLPIQNQSGDAELERAGIGRILADAFVQLLADSSNLYVVSPIRLDVVSRSLGRSFAAAGSDLTFGRQVCEKAGANAMLTGSLARVGGTYVLSANLTELPSDRLRGTFRAESQSSEKLLSDLTGSISEMVRRKLGVAPPAVPRDGVGAVATSSVEAYAHFVRGKELSAEGNWKPALVELKKALEIDPGMALAWSELGCAYSFYGDEANSLAAQKRAEELVDRANRKEQAWIRWNGIWIQSANGERYLEEGRKYIREFPDDRDGYFYAGLGAAWLKKDCSEALTYYQKAYALTPSYYPITKAIVDCEMKLGRKDRAEAALKRFLSLPWAGDQPREQARWRLDGLKKSA